MIRPSILSSRSFLLLSACNWTYNLSDLLFVYNVSNPFIPTCLQRITFVVVCHKRPPPPLPQTSDTARREWFCLGASCGTVSPGKQTTKHRGRGRRGESTTSFCLIVKKATTVVYMINSTQNWDYTYFTFKEPRSLFILINYKCNWKI